MASRQAAVPARGGDGAGAPASRGVHGAVVAGGLVAVALAATWAIAHDAATASPVMSVAAARPSPPPSGVAAAQRATLSFVPEGSALTVGTAIAQATASAPGSWRVSTRRLGSGGWAVNVSAPVDVARLLAHGNIAKGGGAGGSDPGRGLVDVTADQIEYVLRFDPATMMRESELRPGMSGWAKIRCGRRPLGAVVLRRVNRYLRSEVWSWF
ncbi:MAG: hypothetical protein K6V73_11705 [Firmicutes bacterium]|nr:hypothetical protein [Bacillota bacterium]